MKKQREKIKRVDVGEFTGIYLYKYRSYEYGAYSREIPFDLSTTEFMKLWGVNCIYCGSPIETIRIDRIDNDRGYCIDNIVPCCRTCNVMKMNKTQDEFIKACSEVYFTFSKKKQKDLQLKLIVGR